MNKAEYYYKNGCTECGGLVTFIEPTFTYKCEHCGCFASAHRKDTDNSKIYEPYQYLASAKINALRRELESQFNILWTKRTPYKRKHEVKDEAFINIIFNENIRVMIKPLTGDRVMVKVITNDTQTRLCEVYNYENHEILYDVNYDELQSVSNREKSHVWLATKLHINISACKTGYLTEQQLLKAIEICETSIEDAQEKANKTNNTAT